MTFDAYEKSVESGQPIEAYRFVLGAEAFQYTPSEDEQVIESLTYAPTAIKRGRITQSPESRDNVVDFTVSGDNEFARKYISIVPGSLATITVKRVQRPDFPGPEVVTLYEGVVLSVKFSDDGHVAKIATKAVEAALSRPIPRFTYQGLCNNVLYDAGCKVDDTDSTWRLSNAEVLTSVGNTITVQGADGNPDGWYTGGFVEADGGADARMVLNHTGTSLQLMIPFPSGIVGELVTVLAGCDHTIAICHSKFNTPEDVSSNVINYAGFKFIPTKDIFSTGLV